jgi:hypothetical protein
VANVAIKLPPGMVRNGTKEQTQGRWYDGALVRFKDKTIRPWGGWRPLLRATLYADPDYFAEDYVEGPATAVTGATRAARAWRDNDNVARLAFGTNEKLYVYVNGVVSDITPVGLAGGQVDTAAATGAYGRGAYGLGPYGRGDAASQTFTDAAVWRLDNFGEWLVGVLPPSDGKLYLWENNVGVPAAVIAAAPTGLLGVVVSEERFLIVLGSDGNPRRVDWASQETTDVWGALATNTAGGFELVTPGKIICGRRVRGGVLILTDTDAHLMEYVGPPFIYGRRRIGSGGILGPEAIAVLDTGAVWMGRGAFYAYNGGIVTEVPCEELDYVFGDFNIRQGVKVQAAHNAELGVVTWFYPSAASSENDRYIEWNYHENHWSHGPLGRAAVAPKGAYDSPIFFAADGTLYEHETGFDYGSLAPFLESGPFLLGNGDNVLTALALVPDERTLGDTEATFYLYNRATSAETAKGPYTLSEKTDVRFTARRVRVRFDAVRNEDWRIGWPLVDVIQAGRR